MTTLVKHGHRIARTARTNYSRLVFSSPWASSRAMTTSVSSTGRQQSIDAPLTRSATFLVLAAKPGQEALKTIRSTLSGVEGLTKNVAIRDLNSNFVCTVGI